MVYRLYDRNCSGSSYVIIQYMQKSKFKSIYLVVSPLFAFCLLTFNLSASALTPAEVIDKFDAAFVKIKTAQADFRLDTSLQLLGCGGLKRQYGRLFFKAPDKLQFTLDDETYFVRGNIIRKLDQKDRPFYVELHNAPDFSAGFGPKIISHNFNLKLIEESANAILIEGLPKPGVLKNVTKVVFHFAPSSYYLTKMDLTLKQGLTGRININYIKIGETLVPAATWGKSALEVFSGSLVGLTFDLRGENIQANLKLADKIFEAGF